MKFVLHSHNLKIFIYFLFTSNLFMQEEIEQLYDMGQRCMNLGNPKEALQYFTKGFESRS